MNLRHPSSRRRGVSLLEMLASISIIAIIATVVIPRLGTGGSEAKKRACHVNVEIIQIQSLLWKREKGSWPASNLSNVGADTDFFPEGPPTCPLDGSSYTINTTTGMVNGHSH